VNSVIHGMVKLDGVAKAGTKLTLIKQLYVKTVKIRLQKRSNVIIALGVCNQTELYQELEID
jgi:hypothetical protein